MFTTTMPGAQLARADRRLRSPAAATPVADGARHRDHDAADETAEDAEESALHARDRDHDGVTADLVEPVHQPPQARHADVLDASAGDAVKGQGTCDLAADRGVRAAAADDGDLRNRAERTALEKEGGTRHRIVVELRTPAVAERRELLRGKPRQQAGVPPRLVLGEHAFDLRGLLIGTVDRFLEADPRAAAEVDDRLRPALTGARQRRSPAGKPRSESRRAGRAGGRARRCARATPALRR